MRQAAAQSQDEYLELTAIKVALSLSLSLENPLKCATKSVLQSKFFHRQLDTDGLTIELHLQLVAPTTG